MLETFSEWPAPPYFNFAPGTIKTGPESCIVYFRNGNKALGDLVRFSPGESSIVFLPSRNEVNETINLDKIKSIRLVQPLTMLRQETSLEQRAEEVFAASERQTFSLEFTDKETISGETVGHTDSANGLYLYLPKDNDKVVRCFIPKQSIGNFQIGMKLGEMLIEEKLASKEDVDAAVTRQRSLRLQRLGDYLSEHQIVTREELDQAIRHQETRPILKLGEALQQLELITQEQLDAALKKQKENRNIPLGQILIEMGIVDERAVKGALAKKLGIPYVGLSKFNFDHDALRLVNHSLARKHGLIPLCMHENSLVVAFEDPLNLAAVEELRFLIQMKILPVMASHDDVRTAITKHYATHGDSKGHVEFGVEDRVGDDYAYHQSAASDMKIDDLASKLFVEDSGIELTMEPIAESDNTLVQLVNKMILDAFSDGVSDIHIETYPGRSNTRVRFRKDGTLVDYLEIPPNFRNAVISRIKVMSQLDISERRKPQDGKLDFRHFGPAKVELRVATIPTTNNLEDIVMRVLASAKPVAFDKLGLSPENLTALKSMLARPYGLILVCGPTGSGKTTTLHSMLGYINTPGRKIWTAEDPVEITQAGLRQVQINSKIGWTFASAIRSFLRADPDVIMVGEMRDQETAKTGIEASLTGHLVLSTLHTNTAPESVVRLLDLGMDPFNFADALLGVLAQRLAKALCPKCKQAYTPEATEIDELLAEFVEGSSLDPATTIEQWQSAYANKGKFTLYQAAGCDHCNRTGYRGRLGLHELMSVTQPLKRLIQTKAPLNELLSAAFDGGMRTLKQDGITKILQGHTDISQIRSVCM